MKLTQRLLIFMVVSFLLAACGEKKQSFYLVVKTGYFHASRNLGCCNYMNEALKNGYDIKRIDLDDLYMSPYKICKHCFLPEERYSFNTERQHHKEARQRFEENLRLSKIREVEVREIIDSLPEDVIETIIEDFIESQEGYHDPTYDDYDRYERTR